MHTSLTIESYYAVAVAVTGLTSYGWFAIFVLMHAPARHTLPWALGVTAMALVSGYFLINVLVVENATDTRHLLDLYLFWLPFNPLAIGVWLLFCGRLHARSGAPPLPRRMAAILATASLLAAPLEYGPAQHHLLVQTVDGSLAPGPWYIAVGGYMIVAVIVSSALLAHARRAAARRLDAARLSIGLSALQKATWTVCAAVIVGEVSFVFLHHPDDSLSEILLLFSLRYISHAVVRGQIIVERPLPTTNSLTIWRYIVPASALVAVVSVGVLAFSPFLGVSVVIIAGLLVVLLSARDAEALARERRTRAEWRELLRTIWTQRDAGPNEDEAIPGTGRSEGEAILEHGITHLIASLDVTTAVVALDAPLPLSWNGARLFPGAASSLPVFRYPPRAVKRALVPVDIVGPTGWSVAIALGDDDQILGYVYVGDRRDRAALTERDIDLVVAFARSTTDHIRALTFIKRWADGEERLLAYARDRAALTVHEIANTLKPLCVTGTNELLDRADELCAEGRVDEARAAIAQAQAQTGIVLNRCLDLYKQFKNPLEYDDFEVWGVAVGTTQLAQQFGREFPHLDFTYDVAAFERPPVLPMQIGGVFLSVVREAVRNAVGHGGATRVHVVSTRYAHANILTWTIHDNGAGLTPEQIKNALNPTAPSGTYHGLDGLRRALETVLGGTFEISSTPGPPGMGMRTRVYCTVRLDNVAVNVPIRPPLAVHPFHADDDITSAM